MHSLRLHPEADTEGIRAAAHIKEDDPFEAALFKEAVNEALHWVKSEPLIFRCFEDDFRKVKVGKFRYLVIFRIRGDEVQVLAIAHTSRRPGYWKTRASKWPQ